MWRKVLWPVFLMGLLLGPGLWAYERWFSGQVVEEIPLFGPQRVLGGAIERKWMIPVTVHLEPSMNPIAFDFDFSVRPNGGEFDSSLTDVYMGILRLEDRAIWEEEWPAGFTRFRFTRNFRPVKPKHRARLGLVRVREAGDYTFDFPLEIDEGAVNVHELTLKVKRDVTDIPQGAMWFGIAMMVGAALTGYARIRWGPEPEYR